MVNFLEHVLHVYLRLMELVVVVVVVVAALIGIEFKLVEESVVEDLDTLCTGACRVCACVSEFVCCSNEVEMLLST